MGFLRSAGRKLSEWVYLDLFDAKLQYTWMSLFLSYLMNSYSKTSIN